MIVSDTSSVHPQLSGTLSVVIKIFAKLIHVGITSEAFLDTRHAESTFENLCRAIKLWVFLRYLAQISLTLRVTTFLTFIHRLMAQHRQLPAVTIGCARRRTCLR
jgi:hypothetical protein